MTEKKEIKGQIIENREKGKEEKKIKNELIALLTAISMRFSGMVGDVVKKTEELLIQPVYAAEVSESGVKTVEVKTWDEFLNYADELYDTNKAVLIKISKDLFDKNRKELEDGRGDGVDCEVVENGDKYYTILLKGKKRREKNTHIRKLIEEKQKELKEKQKELKEKQKELKEKQKELKEKQKELNYNKKVYLYPSFEIDNLIFEMLNDNYKKEFNKYLNLLEEGLNNGNDEEVKKAMNDILKIAGEVIDKIKKRDKSVYDKRLIDDDMKNNEDIKYIKKELKILISFYEKIDVFYDSVNNPGLVKIWKEKMKNKLLLLGTIVERLKIDNKDKEEIKKLINKLWQIISTKAVVNWS